MKPTYRTALRAKGIRPLPPSWKASTVKKPGDKVLTRNDRPAVTA
ncbi:MAG TPA: hypothetical protein VF638_14445 [Sphingomonas sp.]|jgi:hypothetical protein